MTGRVEQRLKELGVDLPVAAAPAGAYLPTVQTNNLLFVSGQLPFHGTELPYVGKVGEDFTVVEAQAAARLCAINILAQAKAALGGDLDRIIRCVKVGGFVNATAAFTDHPLVVNGASELIVEVLGDAGRHARFAVGVGSLPRGVAVEVEAHFEVS